LAAKGYGLAKISVDNNHYYVGTFTFLLLHDKGLEKA